MPETLQVPSNTAAWEPPTDASVEMPFTINGAPIVNPPASVKGLSLKRNNEPNPNRDVDDFLVSLETDHILPADPNTTLRYQNRNYSLAFACIHRALKYSANLTDREKRPQLSLVFLDSRSSIFHINVPINLVNTSVDENLFLNSWLYTNGTKKLPSGYTFNQILQVKPTDPTKPINVRIINYGNLVHGNEDPKKETPYVLCEFEDPVKLNRNRMPSWFRQNEEMNDQEPIPSKNQNFRPWRPKTFDAILNIMLDAIFSVNVTKTLKDNDGKVIAKPKYQYSAADQAYFTAGNLDTDKTKPAYYKLDLIQLLGKAFLQPFFNTGKRPLKNVKCYPLDVNNDIDDEGKIVVDPTTKKPISVRRLEDTNTEDKEKAAEAQKALWDTTLRYLIWIVVGIILLVLLIVVVVVFFSGRVRTRALEKATKILAEEQVKAAKASFGPTPTVP